MNFQYDLYKSLSTSSNRFAMQDFKATFLYSLSTIKRLSVFKILIGT